MNVVPPLIVILGETASGKSAIAMDLAARFDGEIIAADSMTAYKYFDIATAKPTAEDRATIRHHLINVADPARGFSVADFALLANEAVNDIDKRGKVPILVGGSGLYIDSMLFGFGFRPMADIGLRDSLNRMDNQQLVACVRELGLSTEAIDILNNRRLIRLIETKGAQPARAAIRTNTLVIGTIVEKERLADAIAKRVDDMFQQGLEEEVLGLSLRYGWDVEAMHGIGYREFRDYFAGRQTLEQTKELIVIHTRQLAKKQRTWFRRNNSIQWCSDRQEIVELVTTFLNNYRR